MELVYANEKLEQQCTKVSEAKKLFNGNAVLATSLLARINALEKAESIKDIIVDQCIEDYGRDEEIAKELQNGNKSNSGTKSQD